MKTNILNDLARSWLRRIAIGLPLVSGGCFCDLGCPNPRTEVILLSRASISSDGGTPTCEEYCRAGAFAYVVDEVHECEFVTADGGPAVECTYDQICGGGRRPAGYERAMVRAPSEVAAWLGELAALESASVGAFQDLARELRAHGAPAGLVRAALRSAGDEVRHADAVGSLARAAGAPESRVVHQPAPVRTLEAVALDDAVEGCARETLGALIAAHQAVSASDPVVRRAFRGIARDEARHALLSAAVLDWAAERLGQRSARALDEARRAELDRLARTETTDPAPSLRSLLGLPTAERARGYISVLAT